MHAAPALALLLLLTVIEAGAEEPPFAHLGILDRLKYSDLVCAAMVLDTQPTGQVVVLENNARTAEFIARAAVDQVFKGSLSDHSILFRWFRWPVPVGIAGGTGEGVYGGPPLADLEPGQRYILFLRGGEPSELRVTVPMYQSEIPLAPEASVETEIRLDASRLSEGERNLALAREIAVALSTFTGDEAQRAAFSYLDFISQLLQKRAIPLIRPLLESESPWVRLLAAEHLARQGSDAGRNVLLDLARNEALDPYLRGGAAQTLGQLHAREALPELRQLAVEASHPAARRGALYALRELADPQSIDVLIRALDDPEQENRYLAAGALEHIVLGGFWAMDVFKAHEQEIIDAWKTWSRQRSAPPDYSRFQQ